MALMPENLSVIIPIEKTVTVVWIESPMGEFPSPNTSSTDFPWFLIQNRFEETFFVTQHSFSCDVQDICSLDSLVIHWLKLSFYPSLFQVFHSFKRRRSILWIGKTLTESKGLGIQESRRCKLMRRKRNLLNFMPQLLSLSKTLVMLLFISFRSLH